MPLIKIQFGPPKGREPLSPGVSGPEPGATTRGTSITVSPRELSICISKTQRPGSLQRMSSS